MQSDTIAALATAPGEAGIAIVRISGPNTLAIADRVIVCRPPRPSARASHHAFLAHIRGESGRFLDRALILPMRAPRSYTGEDVVEVQCHGGRMACRQILAAVCAAGARVAEPGEFTRRAFLNGRIDLLQAEAVLDLIRAQSDRAARMALEQLEGRLTDRVNSLYRETMAAAAAIESAIDFIEEISSEEVANEALPHIRRAVDEASSLLSTSNGGRILREGLRVAILGPPNAGKSTLFNALLGYERAIVTPHPGTTRDTIEESMVINGIPIRLTDTAGIRETTCEIESLGVDRSKMELNKSDVIVYVVDANIGISSSDQQLIEQAHGAKVLIVYNKSDTCGFEKKHHQHGIAASALMLKGMDEIKSAISAIFAAAGEQESDVFVSERHTQQLRKAISELKSAEKLLNGRMGDRLPLAALHIKSAALAIGEITGQEYQSDLLDSIFSRFCVGK